MNQSVLLFLFLASCGSDQVQVTTTLNIGEATKFTVDGGEQAVAGVVVTHEWPSLMEAATNPLEVVATFQDGAFGDFFVASACFSDEKPDVEITKVSCNYTLVRHRSFAGTLGDPGADGTCVCDGGGQEYTWDSTKAY